MPGHPSGPTSKLDLSDEPVEALPLALHLVQRQMAVGALLEVTVGRSVGWDRFDDLVVGAGFGIHQSGNHQPGIHHAGPHEDPPAGTLNSLVAVAIRQHTLADSVAPGMRLLVCGVNPSPFSADAGVGYARPGNRFWPAVLAAGIAVIDRDPVAALGGGLGMTDFAKRPTRTAAEVTRAEYESGFARVSRLVQWLTPGAVCFVGLSGWRTVVDRHAVAGVQPSPVGGRPAYVMPSTSGLNARTSLAGLADHLRAAWALGEGLS